MTESKTLQKKQSSFPLKTSHLRLIDVKNLPATLAGQGINEDNKYPFARVSSDFDALKAHTVSKNTEQVKAYLYELEESGTYEEIFRSFDVELEFLSFKTDEQIREYVKRSPELVFSPAEFTYFLFKNKEDEYFVASVNRNDSLRLDIDVDKLLGYHDPLFASDYDSHFVVLGRKN